MNQWQRGVVAKYNLWRERAIPFAQELAERISRLKGTFYPGCGFHYDKEERAVRITHMLSEKLPYIRESLWKDAIVRLSLEMLASDVAAAEKGVVEK